MDNLRSPKGFKYSFRSKILYLIGKILYDTKNYEKEADKNLRSLKCMKSVNNRHSFTLITRKSV